MRAVCWNGKYDVRVENVPDPKIINPRDAIIRITSTAICGSDLHLYDGVIPGMKKGDILGHEFMGEVVEVGRGVGNLKVGDRVVVPFTISCGNCFFCQKELYSLCDNSNPNAVVLEQLYDFSGAGIYGYSHLYGGYAGGQAEYARVPFADVGPLKVPDGMSDEQVLFLSDIFPTGYMAAEVANIQPGDVVAVWGAGPVGQFAIQSAFMLGAERVISIDRVPARLLMSRDVSKAEFLNYTEADVVQELKQMTAGRGPDVCIDAVGLEAHGFSADAVLDQAKYILKLTKDKAHALRQAIQACRKGGVVSVPGVYAGLVDKLPFGAAFGKGLQFRMGQTHVQKYMRPLLERVQKGDIDPTFVITHRMSLNDAAEGYRLFRDREGDCIKVVLKP